jgi:hypothetical protein
MARKIYYTCEWWKLHKEELRLLTPALFTAKYNVPRGVVSNHRRALGFSMPQENKSASSDWWIKHEAELKIMSAQDFVKKYHARVGSEATVAKWKQKLEITKKIKCRIIYDFNWWKVHTNELKNVPAANFANKYGMALSVVYRYKKKFGIPNRKYKDTR